MEKQIITVYFKERPYHFTMNIVREGEITTYQVEPEPDAESLLEHVPEDMEFDVNGKVQLDERIQTVEGVEIASLIWDEIRKKLEE